MRQVDYIVVGFHCNTLNYGLRTMDYELRFVSPYLLVSFSGRRPFGITCPLEDGVLAETLFDVEQSFLHTAFLFGLLKIST